MSFLLGKHNIGGHSGARSYQMTGGRIAEDCFNIGLTPKNLSTDATFGAKFNFDHELNNLPSIDSHRNNKDRKGKPNHFQFSELSRKLKSNRSKDKAGMIWHQRGAGRNIGQPAGLFGQKVTTRDSAINTTKESAVQTMDPAYFGKRNSHQQRNSIAYSSCGFIERPSTVLAPCAYRLFKQPRFAMSEVKGSKRNSRKSNSVDVDHRFVCQSC